jgi:dihydroflavonol-4-reductase
MLRENAAVTTSVLGAAARQRTPLVVYVSSAIVFAPHGADRGGVTDVESPLWDESTRRWGDPYLRSKVLAEEQARDAAARGVPVTFIHPALVVGPDDRGPGTSGGPLLRMLHGRTTVEGAGGWVDVRDVADAMVAACSRPAGGRHLLSAETVSYRGIARRLDVVTRRRRRHLIIPRAVTRVVAPLNDLARGRLVAALPTRPSLEYILTASRIDGSSGEALLGRPYRRLDDTLRDAVAWWVEHGMLDARDAGAAAPARHAAP